MTDATATRPAPPETPPRRLSRALRPASLGAAPTGERLARILRSPNFRDGSFRNTEEARGMRPGFLKAYLRAPDRARRRPAGPVPVYGRTAADLARPSTSGLRTTWMGHASALVEIDGARVLIDPVWGPRCSPFTFAGPKRMHRPPIHLTELGPVDVVVISHDHYDHLDMPTIRALVATGAVFAVPLGVGAHLEHWGVPAARIVELDWDESAEIAGLTLTATPARHFCGRTVRSGTHTLWASWVIAGPDHKVFHSGDTGYFPGFAEIGAQHGPFDVSMIQVGAFSEFWPDVHMTPEEGMRAHADLTGGIFVPIHWCTFNLALHPWDDPAERSVTAAGATGSRIAVPRPGEPFEVDAVLPVDPWWRFGAASRP